MGLLELFSEGKKYLKDAMPGGLLNQEWTPENVRTAAEVTSMIPNPMGDVASGLLAADDLRKGNYGDAALNGLGLLPFVPAMSGVIHGGKIADALNAAHGSKIDATLTEGKNVVLNKVVANNKNSGDGTAFMNDLVALADKDGKIVALSPASDFGGSKSRLIDFYKRFGFVPNAGKNKDFTISESMYRNPK